MVITITQHALQGFSSDTLQIATNRIAHTWQWYIIRGAGFTAAALLISLMLSGIGQVTGLTYRFLEPVKAWAVHKAMGIALCVAIAVHVLFLLLDQVMPFGVLDITVPFHSTYTNGSALLGWHPGMWATGLGVLAMYSVFVVIASSLTIIDSDKRSWRWLHYLNYFTITAVFVHAVSVGSDLKYGTFRAAWVAVSGVVVLAIISRLFRAGTIKRRHNS